MTGIYIIRSGGFYKIGTTNDIVKRTMNLQTGNPVKLEVMVYIETDKAAEIEKALHNKFYNDNVQGEWFTTAYPKLKRSLLQMINVFTDKED